jgi:predicted site-specific integrase-resolvase
MAEVRKNGAKRTINVPEFLNDKLEDAKERFTKLEESAEKSVKELIAKGKASRKDLEALLVKVSKDDRVTGFRGRLEKLQRTGAVRAEELRDRAETFRAEALERIVELQGKAVKFLGVATREQVEELHRELDRLAKRFEKREKARPSKRAEKKGEV